MRTSTYKARSFFGSLSTLHELDLLKGIFHGFRWRPKSNGRLKPILIIPAEMLYQDKLGKPSGSLCRCLVLPPFSEPPSLWKHHESQKLTFRDCNWDHTPSISFKLCINSNDAWLHLIAQRPGLGWSSRSRQVSGGWSRAGLMVVWTRPDL
jgi:hypothetical protein